MTEQGIGVLPGLWPIHGDGVLARQGNLVLLIHPAGGAFTDRLLDLLTEAARAGQTGLRFASLISWEFDSDAAAAASGQPSPAAVAFGPAEDGLAIALYGTAWAEITTAHGTQQLSAGQPYGRLHCVLPSPVMKVRAGVQAPNDDVSTDPYLRLADGVVRAVALVYAPEATQERPAGQARQALLPERTIMDAGWAGQAAAQSDQPGQAEQASQAPQAEPIGQSEPAPFSAEPSVYQQEAGQAEPPAYEPQAARVDNTFYEPDAGHVAYQPDAGQGGQPAYEPPAARVDNTFYEPDAGHVAYQPDAGQRAYQPDPGQGGQPAYQPGPGQGGQAGQPAYQPDEARADHVVGDPFEADSLAGRSFTSIPLIGDMAGTELPQRDPLPLGAEPPDEREPGSADHHPAVVVGVYCKNGHFDDPEARYCAVCGIGMAQLTKTPQEGPRPPLGVLVLQDGSVCQLDTDYVLGREPTLDSSVADGTARPLRLGTASGLVSRIHARVELDGWQVFISDLNSANGTQILQPGENSPETLQPGIRTPLAAGAQIRLGGDYGLRYDSHRHR
ncbi:MAG: FHA domain-containing protein [Streptosporangiaceae bacterium]